MQLVGIWRTQEGGKIAEPFKLTHSPTSPLSLSFLRWLTLIEKNTDRFLAELGFQHNSLPYNYTDVPPADLPLVYSNLNIIKKMISGQGEGEGEEEGGEGREKEKRGLKVLIRSISHTVHGVVSLFVSDLLFLVSDEFELHRMVRRERGREWADLGKDGVKRDLEYLVEMREMDAEIEKRWEEEEEGKGGEEKRGKDEENEEKNHQEKKEKKQKSEKKAKKGLQKVEMSTVVPISGLVMARLFFFSFSLSFFFFLFFFSFLVKFS